MAADASALIVVPARPWARFTGLLRRSFIAAYEDGCFGIAKGAAYSALLAFFPICTSIAAILAQVRAESVSAQISRFLFEVVPPGSQELVRYVFSYHGARPIWLLIAASLLAVWAGTGVMMTLMEGFQAAYKLPTGRPFLQQRLVAVVLVFSAALPVVGASMLILFSRSFTRWLGVPAGAQAPGWLILSTEAINYLIAFAAILLVTCLLYFFGPNRPMKMRDVWPGAVLATVLWLPATGGFGWYVRHIANYNLLYGSVAASIIFIVWMYMLAVIALLGCEFNAERECQG
ncbi:MAG TPA: YihY/virulence factor BrkB family protein [Bryobacteraceae bacterium]|jgi:membrane protein|nr:YihY/virulence factor BrkB family protein [Bryobacteraceae bacterium]